MADELIVYRHADGLPAVQLRAREATVWLTQAEIADLYGTSVSNVAHITRRIIEDGEIVGRVKDLSLAGNVYDLLRSIGGISREQQWVHGRYLLPHILLNEVDVVRGR